jgi:sel1 domain protein
MTDSEKIRFYFLGIPTIFAILFLILSGAKSVFFPSCEERDKDFNKNIILAQAGDKEAQFFVGRMYSGAIRCDSARKNIEKAVYWLEQAAKQGHNLAQISLAEMYEKGVEIPHNSNNAAYWYYQSALQEDSRSQYILAGFYEKGYGVIKSNESALYWYQKSYNNGNPDAAYKLGVVYDDGLLGVLENNEIALSYFKQFRKLSGKNNFDSRIYILEHPVDTSKLGTYAKSSNLSEYTSPNDYAPSIYHGVDDEPTALCEDGTYSYSLARSGVCSHHGGVAFWY